MKKLFFLSIILLATGIALAQKVSIGHTVPVAKLDIRGTAASPSIPGFLSTGVLRVGISSQEGIDVGKMGSPSYAGWIQSGVGGVLTDPLTLQPLGGNVGIGIVNPAYPLDVTGNQSSTGYFINTGTAGDNAGVTGVCSNTPGGGFGVKAIGGFRGVQGEALLSGSGQRFGLFGAGANGELNYGVYGLAYNGTTAYGVYGRAFGASNNFAGYFADGSVFVQNNLGIGTETPSAKLQVSHNSSSDTPQLLLYESQSTDYSRLQFQNGSGSTFWGIAAYNHASNANERMVFYNNTIGEIVTIKGNGRVGIGTTTPNATLNVVGNLYYTGIFRNTTSIATSIDDDPKGVYAVCDSIPNLGTGVLGVGGRAGVRGYADRPGSGSRYGVLGEAFHGEFNFGLHGDAGGGSEAYGIYAVAHSTPAAYGIYAVAVSGMPSATNYAGYFQGDVYAAAYYYTSDRKLKDHIKPLYGALAIIDELKPSVFTFKTKEYERMHLPEGLRYGLIADEVQLVIPGAVKKAVQPAEYEDHDHNGKKINDAVEFNTVNYTEMIPILIAAVQEQQVQIEELKKEIEVLKKDR